MGLKLCLLVTKMIKNKDGKSVDNKQKKKQKKWDSLINKLVPFRIKPLRNSLSPLSAKLLIKGLGNHRHHSFKWIKVCD